MNRTRLKRPAAISFLLTVAALLWHWLSTPPPLADSPLAACLGESMPMQVSRQMPYVQVAVDGRPGAFVIDFGADVSAITPAGFGGVPPQPLPGTADRYRRVDFFGPWPNARLLLQASAPVAGGLPQAGVIGTDFLGGHVFTLDYAGARVHRAAQGRFCGEAALRQAGFAALSTAGYYAANTATLQCPSAGMRGRCPNIPVLPVRIGPVTAVAQIDTGFDDTRVPHAININTAFLQALQQAGVALVPRPDIALTLSTCQAGVTERVEAWSLPRGVALEFIGADGSAVKRFADATLFVKHPPPAARVCGGIGIWPQPAAQLGASFFAGDALIVDPFSARVWLR
jgi:hypothetical protein